MTDYDVFNGDADGICALHQLRLAEPRKAKLITGVKRDIRLLDRIVREVQAGDCLTVLDISVEPNLDALHSILERGATVHWFDHHHPGQLPEHQSFHPVIDLRADVCTSLLVDRHLSGKHRAWAIVGLFGDALPLVARRLAADMGLDAAATGTLARLGEAINYNAYGETIADLFLAPAELYGRISRYADPLEFAAADSVAGELTELLSKDLAQALSIEPAIKDDAATAFILPDTPWARRISGHFANHVAEQHSAQAVAVLTTLRGGHHQVSVRAPKTRPVGADSLCRKFPTGGGRAGAGGINHLAPEAVDGFLRTFVEHFSGAPD